MTKPKTRVKSVEETTNETEFYRRASMPYVTTRYVGTTDVRLSANGVEVGSKSTYAKRGKVVSVIYILPSLEKYEALMALQILALITDDEDQHTKLRAFEEHDAQWVECLTCGRQWSIHKAESSTGRKYLTAEQVSEGDNYCDENYKDES